MQVVDLSVYEFQGKKPVIGKGSFVFPSADVIGDVKIGNNCYIGPGARIRGDYGKIEIGSGSAVEENVVVHARPDDKTLIGSNVTIGHGSIIHNAKIDDWAVIGMGAVVSDWAHVGEWAVIGEGGLVKNKQSIPSEGIAVGVPVKIISSVSPSYKKQWTRFKWIYVELANKWYPESLKKIQ